MEIVPFESVGSLRFGDLRSTIRERLGTPCTSFFKGSDSTMATDVYDDRCLHIYYDDADRLEFVEAFGTADVTFEGLQLLGRNIVAVQEDLVRAGFVTRFEQASLKVAEAGIALFAPGSVVESVACHRQGYYD